MTKFNTLFNKFTVGEVSQKLFALVDYEGYNHAARKLRNVVVIPQGGAKRRFGTRYVATVTDLTHSPPLPISNPAQVQTVTYIVNPTTKFKLVFRPDTTSNIAVDIYLGQVYQQSVGISAYKASLIGQLQFIAGQNRVIILHGSVQPHELVLGIMNTWTASQITFREFPTFDYSNLDGVPYFTQTFTVTSTSGDLDTEGSTATISSTGTPFTNNHVGGAFYYGSGKIRITSVVDASNCAGRLVSPFGDPGNPTTSPLVVDGSEVVVREVLWNNGASPTETPDYYLWDYNLSVPGGSNYTIGTTVTITAVNGPAGAGPFSMSTVNQFLMFYGILQFNALTDSHTMVGIVTQAFNVPFVDNIFAPGNLVTITNSSSPLAGPNRGWPATGGIYQGRLCLGRNYGTPYRVACSQTFDFYNFDDVGNTGTADSDGFGFNVGSEGNEIVQRIVGNKSFVALGFNGPSASSLFEQTAMTPTSFYITQQTNDGCADVDAVVIDNQILYVYSNNQNVLNMSYDIGSSGYLINNANILSPDLIVNPTHATAYRPQTNDGNFYMITNGDGTMATYQTVENEKIKAWSLHHTNGQFIDVEGAKDECSTLVQREISTGATASGLMDSAYFVDSSFQVFTEATLALNGNIGPTVVFESQGDYIVFGCEIYITKIQVALAVNASANCHLLFEYFTNTGWVAFTPTDGTTGFTASGAISWTASQVTGWIPSQPNPYVIDDYLYNDYYYIRVSRTAETLMTPPQVTTIHSNVATRIYYEEITFDALMDCQMTVNADSSGNLSGLDPLAGQMVFAYVNNFPSGSYLVASDGTLSLGSYAANATVTVGIDFTIEIVPMPLAIPTQAGWNVYQPKSINNIYVDFYQTLGLTLNGTPVQGSDPSTLLTQTTLIPETGYEKVPVFGGWDPRQTITLSQSYPAPMTLRAVSYVVEV